MQPMEDEDCSQQFQEIYQQPKSAEDYTFDQIIMELQEIMIDPEFETSLTQFMENHWAIFNEQSNKNNQLKVFQEYRTQMQSYLQNKIRLKIGDFEWRAFWILFQNRKNLVDQQILDTLLSLQEVQSFKSFIKDYRKSYEEVEMFKVLTIKSNKISENKKVKGKDNIFAAGNNGMPDLFSKNLKAPIVKKEAKQKTQDELMVPDMILTVKGMRKE